MITVHDVAFSWDRLALVATSFAMCATLCAMVRRYASRMGLLDRPGGHKGHSTPIPLGGGVAIWLTTVGILALGCSVCTFWGRASSLALWPGTPAVFFSGPLS